MNPDAQSGYGRESNPTTDAVSGKLQVILDTSPRNETSPAIASGLLVVGSCQLRANRTNRERESYHWRFCCVKQSLTLRRCTNRRKSTMPSPALYLRITTDSAA